MQPSQLNYLQTNQWKQLIKVAAVFVLLVSSSWRNAESSAQFHNKLISQILLISHVKLISQAEWISQILLISQVKWISCRLESF